MSTATMTSNPRPVSSTSSTVATTDPPGAHTDDRAGSTLKLVAPVGLGLFPLGIGYGVLVIHAGLPWWWAPLSTGLVYAGSLEFLLIPIALVATPLLAVAATALVVNGRHVFYALSFPLHQVRGRLARTYATFGLTDEAYALAAGPQAQTWTSKRILVLQLLPQSFWGAGATLGALAGTRLPLDRLQGLDFALTAPPGWPCSAPSPPTPCSPSRCCLWPSPCSPACWWPAPPSPAERQPMPDIRYLLGLVLVSAAITWALRARPFAVLAPMRRCPLIGRLAGQLPLGVMLILALSTVRGVSVDDGRALGFVLAVAVTIALQLWRRSFVLSIVAGTATYVAISTALASH